MRRLLRGWVPPGRGAPALSFVSQMMHMQRGHQVSATLVFLPFLLNHKTTT